MARHRCPIVACPISSNLDSDLDTLDSGPGTDIGTSGSNPRVLVADKIAEDIPEPDMIDDDRNCNLPTCSYKISRILDTLDIHIEETHDDLNQT